MGRFQENLTSVQQWIRWTDTSHNIILRTYEILLYTDVLK